VDGILWDAYKTLLTIREKVYKYAIHAGSPDLGGEQNKVIYGRQRKTSGTEAG
jgi:hypothetical protein